LSQEVEFEVPKWSQLYKMLLLIADKIRKDNFKPDIIVGVSRGGWPPARVAETKGEPTLTQPVSARVAGKKVLVVDEVADTGKSLQLIREHLKAEGACEVRIATIYLKPWSIVKPDYYAKETSRWIVFPWEVKETIRKIVQKCREKGRPAEADIEKLVKAGLSRKLVERFLREILREESC